MAGLRPSHAELPPERRFAHGIGDWMLRNRITARELAMLRLMDQITDKPNWSRLVFDKRTVRQWRVEAAGSSSLINERTWDWCLAELRMKAGEHARTGSVLVLDAGSRISKAEARSLGDDVIRVLRDTSDKLRSQTGPDGMFPRVVNMIHPSFYPLVYGRTAVLPEENNISLGNIWHGTGKGIRSVLEQHPLVEMAMASVRARMSRAGAIPSGLDPDYGLVLETLPDSWSPFPGGRWRKEDSLPWLKEKPWRVSAKFQWLPCDVEFIKHHDGDGHDHVVRITSYINNLHPVEYSEAYGAIEKVIAAAIPEWNKVLIRIDPDVENAKKGWNVSFGRTPPRINLFGLLPAPSDHDGRSGEVERDMKRLEKLCREWHTKDEPAEERQVQKDAILARLRQAPRNPSRSCCAGWPRSNDRSTTPPRLWAYLRDLVHPEPGLLFSPEEWAAGKKVGRVFVPKVLDRRERVGWDLDPVPHIPFPEDFVDRDPDGEGFYREGPLDFADRPPVRLHVDYREKGLQVYVKMQSIALTPDSPMLCEGEWGFEGTLNEHIVATSIYVLAAENVTDVRVAFCQPARFCDKDLFNSDAPEVASVFAWEGKYMMCRKIHHMQELGTVSLSGNGKPGRRLLSFPNTLQYRLDPVSLKDPTRLGRVDILVLCLADPSYRLMSTSRVPPQDFSWWLRDAFPRRYLASRGLPAELQYRIAGLCLPSQEEEEEDDDGDHHHHHPHHHHHHHHHHQQFMGEEEVRRFRVETAAERRRLASEVNREYWENDWIGEEWLGEDSSQFECWSDAGDTVDFRTRELDESDGKT